MSREFTSRVEAAITPHLRHKLEEEARRRHHNLSKTVRILLAEALSSSEADLQNLTKPKEYEIRLTLKQAARLKKLGYQLTPIEATQLALPDL